MPRNKKVLLNAPFMIRLITLAIASKKEKVSSAVKLKMRLQRGLGSLLDNVTRKVTRLSSHDLRKAWGDFVDQVGDRKSGWDLYATLTFRDRTPEEVAQGWSQVGRKYSEKACNRFLGYLGELKGLNDLWWFRAREISPWRGVPHYHLLIGGTKELRRDVMWDWWFHRYGFARVLPYDSSLGARFYLCKYVTKDLGDFEFSKNLVEAIS